MDLFLEGLRFARRRNPGALVQADVLRLPFRGRFDLVCLFDVLEHLPDDAVALRPLGHLLRPGGSLLVTVPAHRALWSAVDEASSHRRRYSVSGLKTALQRAGFEVSFLSPFMAPLLPLLWLRRRAGFAARSRTPGDPGADRAILRDLRVVPVLNGLLERILALEAGFVARRVPLPFGSSIIARAVKPS
jgi:SAM-dependent methyltransferase